MKKNIYLIALALLVGFSSHCQIAAWDFFGQSMPVTCAATTFNVNLVTTGGANNITRGPAAPASGGVHSFRTTGFQNNGISTSASDYFQVTLRAVPGFKLSLSTLDAKFNGTTTFFASPGVTSQFAYSLDGVTFNLIGNPVQSTALTMVQVNLSGISDLQNVYTETMVTIRYYASGQTSTGGWGFYSGSSGINGLAIGGTLTEALITAPSVQASGITFSNIQQTQMSVSWITGNGEKRLVKINTTNNFTDPANGTDPIANPVYAGSGEQVVYNYSGSSIPVVTGLTTGVSYWFRVYEYNGSGTLTMFNSFPATNNPSGQATSAILLAPSVCCPTATSISSGSAILGGHITSDGGSPVTERGSVWSLISPVTVSDNKISEGGTDTGFFSHQRTMLPPAMQIYYAAYASNTIGTTLSAEAIFFTLATEPPSHVTGFTASTAGTTAIDLSWIPVVPGADGYLILQKQGVVAPAALPSDAMQYPPGFILGDAIVTANVLPGTAGSCTINGLSPGTAYTFSVFPFTWDGANIQTINYLTQAPVPVASASTGVPSAATYHWTGAAGNDWGVAGNWSPIRSIPALNDILYIDPGGIISIINVPAQTIGQLNVLANTSVTLQGAGTLNIAGDTGDDLMVVNGCQLNISGTTAVSLALAAGANGTIHGSMVFSGGGHRLLAASANGLVFTSGSMFKTGSGFTGNPFGTVSLNSVVFNAGSVYVCQAGGNPFGAAAPASVVAFQPGSLYRTDAYSVPSFGGRTYGNFEMNYPGTITVSGSSAVSIDHFTASQGTFYFNMTGSPGHSIRGNIFVANVATLIFAPASAGTVVFNGAVPQTISGSGSLMAGPFSTLTFGNSGGVTLNMNATFHNMNISVGGLFVVGPDAELTVNGNLVNGAPATGLIIEPDGSMIHHSVGVTGTVKRNFAAADWADWEDGWHFLSSPVAGQSINSAGGFITTGTGNDFDLYTWSEQDQFWVNFKNTSVPPYFPVINGSSNFESGKGYLAAYQQSGDKLFSGVLNMADVFVENLTITGQTTSSMGWHLLGNPYSSALTWYTGWTTSNIGGVAQTWNEAGRSYTPCNPGEEIPACNGFMVQAVGNPGNSGSLTIPASKRVHGTQAWYKESDYPVIKILAHNLSLPSFQESQIRFNPLSTNDFDSDYDGRFLAGHAPLFYSVCGEEKLAVNSLPAPLEGMMIPFCFEKNTGELFQLEARITGHLPAMVFLIDKKTGTEHNLSVDPVYVFDADSGDPPDRFIITFSHVGLEEQKREKARVSAGDNNIFVTHHGNLRLEVFGMSGKLITSLNLSGAGTEKIVQNIPAGWYLVRLTTEKHVEVKKVFINSSHH